MHTNPAIPPREPELKTSETVPETKIGQTPEVEKSLISTIGAQKLTSAEETQGPPKIQSKSITNNLPEKGSRNPIIRFFNRRFSPITEAEQNQFQTINILVGKAKQALDKAAEYTQRAKYAEKKISGKFPTDESVESSLKYLKDTRKRLDEASTHLSHLEKYELTADRLAEEHSAFDFLPRDIQVLKKNVQVLKNRLEIGEKLLNLETALKNYHPEETWTQLTEVREQTRTLAKILKNFILHHPRLKEDRELQKYINIQNLTGAEMHEIIQNIFPELTNQVERLFDSILEVNKGRIKNLEQQVETLKPLFSIYNEQSRRIDNLEKHLYSESLLNRIYRVFHNKDKLLQQLRDAQAEIKWTHEKIKDEEVFIPEEINWLSKKANLTSLRRDLEAIRMGISFIDDREKVADQMDRLIFTLRQTSKLLAVYDPMMDTLLTKNRGIIKDSIKQIHTTTQQMSKEINPTKLPIGFEKLDALTQLKSLIPIVFPALVQKTDRLFKHIEQQHMHEELMREIQKTGIESPPSEESVETKKELIEEALSLEESIHESSSTIPQENPRPQPGKDELMVIENESVPMGLPLAPALQDEPEVIENEEEFKLESPPTSPQPPSISTTKINPSDKYEGIEGRQSESSREHPSILLEQIRKGKKLNKIQPSLKEKGPGAARSAEELLAEVKAGNINAIFRELIEAVKKGLLKIGEIPVEARNHLSVMQATILSIAARRGTMEDEPDEIEEDKNLEDKDWVE